MAELLVLLVWMSLGVAVEMFTADHERHVAWFAAGALLGPLWWVVLADRRTLAQSVTEPSTGPSSVLARSVDWERGRAT